MMEALSSAETRFLLGATSYVIEAGLVENAAFLRDFVDDMEVVLFRTEDASNLPGGEEIEALIKVKQGSSFGYTIHLPVDIAPMPESRSVQLARSVVESTLPLDPRAYIVHLDGRGLPANPSKNELNAWMEGSVEAVAMLCDVVHDSSLIAVENLERWPPEWFLPMLEVLPVSLTIDVGHLWVQGRDPIPYIERWLHRTKVVHLHGVGRSDHTSLSLVEGKRLRRAIDALRGFEGVLTMEVFGWEDFGSSLKVMESFRSRDLMELESESFL